jgi:putative ATP-dependent endonuclease of OLD family
MLTPGLPLLIIVEGENDVRFLTAISAMLHREITELPDLAQLTTERRAIFLPTAGNNLNEWVTRIATLNKRAFYLFDREQEPETSVKQIVETVNNRAGCHAVLTSKRAVENYLHPVAVLEACNIDLTFDDDTDVASLLALKMMERSGETSWHQLSGKRQRRLHEKAKKMLNVKVAQRMTRALLAERDVRGEVVGWLRTIRQMIEMTF